MQLSSFSLASLVSELKPSVENAFVNKLQLVSDSIFRIRLRTQDKKTADLVIHPNAIFLSSFRLHARPFESGFAAFLDKRLENKRVDSFGQHGLDRIVVFGFRDFDLVAELFGKGNLILLDKQGTVISALHYGSYRDREIKRSQPYKFPAARKTIANVSLEDFKKALAESEESLCDALASLFSVPSAFAIEACANAGVLEKQKANEIAEAQAKKIFSELKKFLPESNQKTLAVVVAIGAEEQLLTFKPKFVSEEKLKVFCSLNEALDETLSRQLFGEAAEEKPLVDKNLLRLEHSIREQAAARERLKKEAEQNSKKAEAIFLHYNEIKGLSDAAKKALAAGETKDAIAEKLFAVARKGNRAAGLFAGIDAKGKKLTIETKE